MVSRVTFDTCVFPAHTPQHPEIVGCDAAICLKRVTRNPLGWLIDNVSDLIRRVLLLAPPYGRHVGPSGFPYNGKQDIAFVASQLYE